MKSIKTFQHVLPSSQREAKRNTKLFHFKYEGSRDPLNHVTWGTKTEKDLLSTIFDMRHFPKYGIIYVPSNVLSE